MPAAAGPLIAPLPWDPSLEIRLGSTLSSGRLLATPLSLRSTGIRRISVSIRLLYLFPLSQSVYLLLTKILLLSQISQRMLIRWLSFTLPVFVDLHRFLFSLVTRQSLQQPSLTCPSHIFSLISKTGSGLWNENKGWTAAISTDRV